MFARANQVYLITNSRNMGLSSGTLNLTPSLSLLTFILCLGNIGGPPTINLFREILSIGALIPISLYLSIPVRLIAFSAAAYTLVYYASINQGKVVNITNPINPMSPSYKVILSVHGMWLILSFLFIL